MSSLLTFIDDSVRARPGPPGFVGDLCLVERCARLDRYWHLSATRAGVTFGYLDGVPEGSTALLIFDEAEGEAIVQGAPCAGSFRIAGESTQLKALFDRYLGGSSWLAVRAGQTK